MRRLRDILRGFQKRQASRPSPIQSAQAARAAALNAYAEAKRRGDSRSVHTAAHELHAATTACLRAEMMAR